MQHQKNLSKVAHEIKDSNERFVKHYLGKYKEPYIPPIWAMVETLSFGALSHWYELTLDNSVKRDVAKSVGMPTVDVMEGVLHALTVVRNTCAHHSRLWNRQFVKAIPNIKKLSSELVVDESTDANGNTQKQVSRKLYNYLVVLSFLMQKIQPSTQWTQRLKLHLLNVDTDKHQAMGFPEDWQTRAIWRGES